jgi:hypothetical protein
MKTSDKKWRDYEEVSTYLLNRLRQELGLTKVEGKQKLAGKSGTEWNIEAKGIRNDDGGIIIIECRRNTTRRQNQERIAGFAWRITDTGAQGGIIVNQLGLQKGAKLVAKAGNIVSIIIDANSTPENFAVEFLNKIFLGLTFNTGSIKISAVPTLLRKCTICGKTFTVKDNETVCKVCM